MNVRDFKIGWRLLRKEPAYSAVVIGGLAVGVAVCFLLLGMVRHAFQYDQHVQGKDELYMLKQSYNVLGQEHGWSEGISLPARDALLAGGLPVMATFWGSREIDMRTGGQVGGNVQTIRLTTVDADFARMFPLKVLAGDLTAAITRPDALALTEETARRLFGHLDVVGKTIQIGTPEMLGGAPDGAPETPETREMNRHAVSGVVSRAYTVSALLANPPVTTSMPFAALTGTNTATWRREFRRNLTTNWGATWGRVYVKFGRDVRPRAVTETIERKFLDSAVYAHMRKESGMRAPDGHNLLEFKLSKLTDNYLDGDLEDQDGHASRTSLLGLATVAVLILLLAATNYVNLATVRTLRRQREIAVRKVMGASAGRVVRQFLSESVLVCLIATALGLVLAWLALPQFSILTQRDFSGMFSPAAIGVSLLGGLALGLLAGAYPTWSAYKVRPTDALSGRGNNESASGMLLRRVLTVLQFATALGLTGMTLAVAWQTRYASTLNPGFDPRPLMVIHAPERIGSVNGRAFYDALKRLPGVSGVAVAGGAITENVNRMDYHRKGAKGVDLSWVAVSPEYFDVHRIRAVSGRVYSPVLEAGYHSTPVGEPFEPRSVVINVSAARELGFASPEAALDQVIAEGGDDSTPIRIIGVVPDIMHRDAKSANHAELYLLSRGADVFTVRSDDDPQELRSAIEIMWPRFFPNHVLQLNSAQSFFTERYADDLRLAELLGVASAIAIAIAAFGIYVLAAYTVQRRAREIVLRKLYGAGGADIAGLVGREFAALLGAAAVLGLPVAYLATQRYMAGFIERAPVGVWTLLGSLLVAALVVLLSTARHTWGAMRAAPAALLRD
jgi:putative ABC transport system permease protein